MSSRALKRNRKGKGTKSRLYKTAARVEATMQRFYLKSNPVICMICLASLLFNLYIPLVTLIALLWIICAPLKVLQTSLIVGVSTWVYLTYSNTKTLLLFLCAISVVFQIFHYLRYMKAKKKEVKVDE